jgi:hypothetical protein
VVEALQSHTDRFLAVQWVAAVVTPVKAVAAKVVLGLAPVPSRLAPMPVVCRAAMVVAVPRSVAAAAAVPALGVENFRGIVPPMQN